MISKTSTLLLCLASLIYCVTSLSVSGNQILDANGKAVLLRGVCRPSFEWNPLGESSSLADYQLMASWGANVVRLSTNQDFWLAGASTHSANYPATIDQQVAWIKQAGMYVIIDLHWSDTGNLGLAGAQQLMADSNSVTFWSQVAARYKNDPSVLFELYNEPHDVAWSVWLNGGSSGSFTVAGMQQLYNAVRATGANNVVVIGGLNWAFDLSGVSAGYAVTGTNIAYATHPYDYDGKQVADWDTAFGNLAAKHPVIMTEFGQYCASDSYVADLLAYATSKGIHWTAWAWYVSGCEFPSIISDWKGTPTSLVGVLVKNALSSSAKPVAPGSSSSSSGSSSSSSDSSSSGSSSSGSSSGSVTPANSALIIFDDQLQNGWLDWSWATINKANTNPVSSGSKSISFTLGPYTALYFHHPSPISVGSYASLQFSINGGSVTTNFIQVKLYDTSATPVAIGNAVTLPVAIQVNKWVTETIPLSAFGLPAGTQFSGVVILYNQNNNGGVIYVDTLSLLPSDAVVSPTKAPIAATSAPVAATKAPISATTAPVAATKVPPKVPVAATTAPKSGSSSSSSSDSDNTFGTSGSTAGCSTASVTISQSLSTSWPTGSGDTIYQYNTIINNLCSNKKIASITFAPTNWNPLQFWNMEVTGTQLTTPSHFSVDAGGSYSSFGYQNKGGMAQFQIISVTFA